MRMKPYLGNEAWFGPRRFGWGWAPCTWQGWLLTALFIAAVVVFRRSPPAILAIVSVELIVIALTGTSPGGPAAAREFRIRRGDIPLVPGGGDDTPNLRGITDNFDRRDLQ